MKKLLPTPLDPQDILALLEAGPKTTGTLAEYLRHRTATVLDACHVLAQVGAIERLPNPDRRWALPGSQLPIADAITLAARDPVYAKRCQRTKPTQEQRAFNHATAEAFEVQAETRAKKPEASGATSWWVTPEAQTSRAEFQQQAVARQHAMSQSRQAAFVGHDKPPRLT